jgi:hypothetical protein
MTESRRSVVVVGVGKLAGRRLDGVVAAVGRHKVRVDFGRDKLDVLVEFPTEFRRRDGRPVGWLPDHVDGWRIRAADMADLRENRREPYDDYRGAL